MNLKLPNKRLIKKRIKKLRYFHKHPFVLPVALFLAMFFISMIFIIGLGGETIGANDSRVVKVYVDNNVQTVPTRAKTVGQLLERLNIKIGSRDIVEPGLDIGITDSGFEVNVYRSRTVLVDDEGSQRIIMTAEPSLKRVAEKAGLKIYPEDKLTKAPVDIIDPVEVIEEGFVAEKIVIDRAVAATINLYGNVVSLRTHSTTVEELLAEKNIKVNQGDSLQPSAETLITPNTKIFISRFGTKLEQVEELIAPPIEYVDDYNLVLGSSTVKEEGKPGKRIVTYEIELKNEQEVARKVLQEVIIEEPVRKLVARGRKAPVIAGNKAEIMQAAGINPNEFYAVDYIISHESGWRVNALNSNGCAGLGQACPGSKLSRACPNWQSDAVCQMKFFNGYAVGRYGSWTRAFEVWQLQRWW